MTTYLYQFPVSHYCEKVRWALDYKRVPYKKINLIPGTHVSRMLRIAERSEVPVLEHHGEVIQGSAAILDFLDKTFPERPLTPADESLAADAREWEARLDSLAGPSVRTFMYHYLLDQPQIIIPMLTAKQPFFVPWMFRAGYRKLSNTMRGWMNINEASAHKAMDDMDRILSDLRKIYANTRFLVGDSFTRADLAACALFAPLYRPSGYGMKWPALKRIPEEMREWLESHEGALRSLALRYEQNR